jgi:16S rRNA (guanine527-N7)-methyltransferase
VPVSGTPEHDGLLELRSRVSGSLEPLLVQAAELGFLGSMPVGEQIDHALGFVFCAETDPSGPPGAVADLGSGGGLPGLVLAACWPDSRITLIDSNERRTAFLESAVERLLKGRNVVVVRGRAEEVSREEAMRQAFDVVTARSFGSPAVTAECAAPLLALGGLLVVSEPPGGEGGTRWPVEGLSELGLTAGATTRFDDRFNYQSILKSAATPERYPRRVGIPAKRPLF